ncbi:uncharacterized protein [Miscanthus floridulus]|uniref:uncharacterized protein n=1 Tax=Miscanthus floridulus TaxID=154761 RepID=UPI00345A672B
MGVLAVVLCSRRRRGRRTDQGSGMDLHAARLDAARHRVVPTSASQRQPRPQQQLGVRDRGRCLPPRPPPSRGETRSGGVGKADEVRGTRDTRLGSGVATREAAPVAADEAAVAAGDAAAAPGVAREDKGKVGAKLGGKRCLDSAEEMGGGDAGRKRGLGLAAYPPPPKRRLVSATRRFPPVYGRAAAAPLAAGNDDSRLVVAQMDGASDALKKTALALSDAKAGSSVMQVESSAEVVSAPIADNGHHGLEAELQRSSEPLRQSGVPSADDLLDTDSQGDAGSAGFARKELVPATRRLLPKPRMVSAVRRFPPGCGRARASLVAGEGSTEVGLPLPEKVVATDCSTSAADKPAMQIVDVPCNATITDRAAQKEKFVEGETAAPKVQPQGSQSCTNVTLHESSACRDGPSVPAISLQSQEKRTSCVVAKDIEVVIKSAGSSANALAQSLSEGPSKEHLVSVKMGRAFSGVAPGASGQGAMKRDKVMSAAQKEVRPAKLIQKFSKIKVKETEHGKCVTTNGSEDTAGFEHQAPTSGKKCLRTDREAAATSRNSFGPKKKGNVKQKSMLPSNVEDDILKALAAHEEKYGAQNVDARSKVKMMRRRFEFIRRAIIRAVKQQSLKLPRIDLAAADLIKKTSGFTQHGPVVGNVLGIEVGDEFLYRVELNIVGLHRPYQGGIDTTRDKYNVLIAISVVASGGYPDQLSRSGELVYTGSGGKISGKKGMGDQKLEKGNLALKNCIRTKTPVRVIHRFNGLNGETPMFTYDGLYNVVDCWREGQPGSKVFKYKLQRIPGQAELHYGSETSHRSKAGITG